MTAFAAYYDFLKNINHLHHADLAVVVYIGIETDFTRREHAVDDLEAKDGVGQRSTLPSPLTSPAEPLTVMKEISSP